jgi:hypothetical protein
MVLFALAAVMIGGSVVVVGASTAGCSDSGVGRKCLSQSAGGADAGALTGSIGSPSLECISRLCYQQGSGDTEHLYCTTRCTTDDDCKSALISQDGHLCGTKFVCAIASPVGQFACQQFCICDTDLVAGQNKDDNGQPICPQTCAAQQKCPTGK